MTRQRDRYLPNLPLEPLARHVERVVEARAKQMGTEEACRSIGIEPRRYVSWHKREYSQVTYAVADRVLQNLGLHYWDIWDEAEYPEVHEKLGAV